MPTALADPSSSRVPRVPAEDELSLTELLDLFAPEDPAAPAQERPSRRSAGTVLRALRLAWGRRTAWTIAPGGAWRAW